MPGVDVSIVGKVTAVMLISDVFLRAMMRSMLPRSGEPAEGCVPVHSCNTPVEAGRPLRPTSNPWPRPGGRRGPLQAPCKIDTARSFGLCDEILLVGASSDGNGHVGFGTDNGCWR